MSREKERIPDKKKREKNPVPPPFPEPFLASECFKMGDNAWYLFIVIF